MVTFFGFTVSCLQDKLSGFENVNYVDKSLHEI